MEWIKAGTTSHHDGSRTIRYVSPGTHVMIESRRRPVKHANGIGSWDYTSYFVILPNGTEKEFHQLRAAKAAAEMLKEARR